MLLECTLHDLTPFVSTESTGANTLAAESVYNAHTQAGDAYSWYVQGGGDGPPEQIK